MSNNKPVIMAVDDDIETVKIFNFFLQKQGYEAIVANSVPEAMAHLESVVPNVLLLDLMLPGLNGEELLKHIRQTPNLADIFVIIVSAHEYDPSKLPTGIAPDAIIRKPIRITQLSETISKALA